MKEREAPETGIRKSDESHVPFDHAIPPVRRAAFVVLLAAVACSDEYTTQPTRVTTVSLGSPVTVLSLREPRLLPASFRDASGNEMTGVSATWTSSNNTIVSVDQNGNLFGAALGGPVTITVTADGQSASTQMTVLPARLEISPGTVSLAVGTTRQLAGTLLDFEGVPIAVDEGVTWSSSNPAVATVGSNSGFVTTLSTGWTVIAATGGGRTSYLDLETGVPTALDGHWTGTSTTTGPTAPRTFPISFEVLFGSVRSFGLSFNSGTGTPCAISLVASSVGATPVVNDAFQVTLEPPPNNVGVGAAAATVSATFTSTSTLTASHTNFRFGIYTGCTAPNGVQFGHLTSVDSGIITATKQSETIRGQQ